MIHIQTNIITHMSRHRTVCWSVWQIVAGSVKGTCSWIMESYYENPREILLFFYYPSEEYISYLMTVDELEFYDEICCEDLFEGNEERERIMIFALQGCP